MGFADAAKDFGKGLIGMTDKAILKIVEVVDEGTEMQELGPASEGGKKPSVKPSGKTDADLRKALQESQKAFKVQFNPNSLKVTGSGGYYHAVRAFEGKQHDSQEAAEKPRLNLTVDLVFNKVDPMDAFLQEKIMISNKANLKGIAKTVGTAVGKNKGRTVQPEVEALLAVLQHNKATMIAFIWGRMMYIGFLKRVKADYKMFNPKGEPIYAVVTLDVILVDEDVTSNGSGYWEDSYKAVFKASEDINDQNPIQKFAGSYLNVGL